MRKYLRTLSSTYLHSHQVDEVHLGEKTAVCLISGYCCKMNKADIARFVKGYSLVLTRGPVQNMSLITNANLHIFMMSKRSFSSLTEHFLVQLGKLYPHQSRISLIQVIFTMLIEIINSLVQIWVNSLVKANVFKSSKIIVISFTSDAYFQFDFIFLPLSLNNIGRKVNYPSE